MNEKFISHIPFIFRRYALFLSILISVSTTFLVFSFIIRFINIMPSLLLVVIILILILISASYVFTILFEVSNPKKYKGLFQTLIEVDDKILVDMELKSFERHLIVWHLFYVIIRAVDVYFEFVFCKGSIDLVILLFLIISMCSDFEVFQFIIECNELARRFERLNAFLLKCTKCELQDGILMKIWNCDCKIRWNFRNELQTAKNIFVKISHATQDLNSCYYSTVNLT